MTIEEEVRAFAEKYMPAGGQEYLSTQVIPPFRGTWEDVFAGRIAVAERTQRQVLRRLRDIFGNREAWGGRSAL
jgi:hypothetical protein